MEFLSGCIKPHLLVDIILSNRLEGNSTFTSSKWYRIDMRELGSLQYDEGDLETPKIASEFNRE